MKHSTAARQRLNDWVDDVAGVDIDHHVRVEVRARDRPRGLWFHLWVLIDIYSRFTPGWIVAAREDSMLAKAFFDEAIARNGAVPHTVHADCGASMTSKPVSALLVDLGGSRSYSRPLGLRRQPLLRGAGQDHDVPARLPRILQHRL